MGLKGKCMFLGIGCCGGKETREFVSLGYKGSAVNGSEQDLKALGDMTKYHLRNFDGFGGHRDRAVDCLAENSEFMRFIEEIKEEIIFVLFGGGGSTGSGCSTLICEMLLEDRDENGNPNKIVCPVISLPSSDEAIIKHRNAYQAVQELQDLEGLGATFFINNDIGRDYGYINSTFAKLLDTFITNNSYSEINNFDESERIEMLKDSGAMVLSLVGNDKDQSLMLTKLSDGIFAPLENNGICENIGIIHSGNNNRDIDKNEIISKIGKPKNVFEGYNNGKSTMIVVSGLNFPVTHVSKLGELAQEAYEERQKTRKQSMHRLSDLSFKDEAAPKAAPERKTPSKLNALRKRMNK